MAAAISIDTKLTINYQRMDLMMAKCGTYVLRQLITWYTSNQVGAYLETNKHQIQGLQKNGRITNFQYKILYPEDNTETCIDEWGIPLLVAVVEFTCTDIPKDVVTTVKDIMDIRNKTMYCSANGEMDNDTFNHLRNKFKSDIDMLQNYLPENVYSEICEAIVKISSDATTEGRSQLSMQQSNTIQKGTLADDGVQEAQGHQVGNIVYYPNRQLGRGPKSVIFRGRYENRDVAVKCIDCSSNKAARETMDDIRKVYREIYIMNKLDQTGHENIVRYYVSERQETNVYLVLELCDGTLKDYINTPEWKQKLSPTAVTLHMARGLHYLASLNFAHRDIKPENVLIRNIDMPSPKAVIADFGQSKVTVGDLFSFTGAFGAPGYIAPEAYDAILQSSQDESVASQMSSQTDLFSLGCLFYFTLTDGAHPFGGKNPVASQHNILCRASPVFDKLPKWQYAMEKLIARMIQMKPEDRPSTTQILQHPALWASDTVIRNFTDANACIDPDILQAGYVPDPPNNDWLQNLPNYTRDYLQGYRNGKYYGGRGKDAAYHLKAIRNLEIHFKEIPEKVRNEMGDSNDDHVKFWLTANPTFLMHVYSKMETCPDQI